MSQKWDVPPMSRWGFSGSSTVTQSAAELQARQRAEKLRELESDPYIGYSSLKESDDDCSCSPQTEVLSRLLNGENVFISGPAGSGKTTVINRFIDQLDSEFDGAISIAKTATTGIAAQLIGGRTIHSWAGLGIDTSPFNKDDIKPSMWAARNRIVETNVLIIDEISMMPAYLFVKLDEMLKFFRKSEKPFGGLQVVLMGDFLQLPPVSKDKGLDSSFAITTDSWKELDPKYCYMDKIRRSTDPELKHLLWKISLGKGLDEKAKESVRSRMQDKVKKDPNKTYTTLFTTNRSIEKYNKEMLNQNTNELIVCHSQDYFGDQKDIERIYKEQGVSRKLEFKIGATVIITSNRVGTENTSNGSIGVITNYVKETGDFFIKMNNGETISLSKIDYTLKKEVEYVDPDDNKIKKRDQEVAMVYQYPMKLGYAISVHKSQGQTFDGIVADLSNIFAPGLGYVALSRVRSIDDLIIEKIDRKAFQVDPLSLKINRFVKKRALMNNQNFKENYELYDDILTNSLTRLAKWSGNNEQPLDEPIF